LARFLGLPDEVVNRPPTTDTYSLPQGQDEFFFSVSTEVMDLCLYGKNHGLSPDFVAESAGLTPGQVLGIYRDIEARRAATRYLHLPPLFAAEIPEISP
jgi:NAD+ synthase